MERTVVVDNFETFIGSEWDTIRKLQDIVGNWEIDKPRLPQECCGVLFYSKRALATNGHWLISCECVGEYHGCDHFFYNYTTDEIQQNTNPLAKLGLDIQTIKSVLFDWQPYIAKVKIEDIINTVQEYYITIKEQRRVQFTGVILNNFLHIRLHNRDNHVHNIQIPLWRKSLHNNIQFSVNCGYLTKLLKIVSSFGYYIIDLCFSNDPYKPVILKAVNRRNHKVPIKIALGQYHFPQTTKYNF